MFGISRSELKIFLEQSLNKKERCLLLESYKLQGKTFSSVVRLLNKTYPESTSKAILQRLKNFNLMGFGDQKRKGRPLVFTPLGNMFFEILKDDKDE